MPTYFMEQFFSYPEVNGGWSEGFYTDAPSHQAVATKYTKTGGLRDKRRQILGSWCRMDYIRISDVDIKGDAFHWVLDVTGSITTDATHSPSDPWTAMNVRVFNDDYSRNATFWLHGIWNQLFLPNRGYDEGNPDDSIFDEWVNAIVTDEWAWRSLHLGEVEITYVVPAFFDFRKKTEKKIGRPFGLLVGRRGKRTSAPSALAGLHSTSLGPATPPSFASSPTPTRPPSSTGTSSHRVHHSSPTPTASPP